MENSSIQYPIDLVIKCLEDSIIAVFDAQSNLIDRFYLEGRPYDPVALIQATSDIVEPLKTRLKLACEQRDNGVKTSSDLCICGKVSMFVTLLNGVVNPELKNITLADIYARS